jgi:transposase
LAGNYRWGGWPLTRERSVLHADETPVPQLDPGTGKAKKAYLWAYRKNDLEPGPPILVFDYQPGRHGVHARNYLERWQGHLMVDDYAAYTALFTEGVTELACLAHARRKFFDLYAANQSLVAAEALRRIGELYEVERLATGMDAARRLQLRQAHARPKLDALRTWLIQTRLTVANGGGTAKALDYSIRRWPALMPYADSGVRRIDNNAPKNAIRPIAIGKKNWLFAGSERAGKRVAAIQSLLGTAKLNGLDPHVCVKDTLEKLPAWPNSRIDELLPLQAVLL